MIKSNLRATVATFVATALVSPILVSSPTLAKSANTSFVCGLWQGVPATVAMTSPKNVVPVLLWESKHFSDAGYDPLTRCQMVSSRFQYYYDSGKLNYLTTGLVNRMPVVCVAEKKGGACNGVLFTLKPGSNPSQALQELLAVRVRAKGPLNETLGRVYIDFQEYLEGTQTSFSDSSNLTSDR